MPIQPQTLQNEEGDRWRAAFLDMLYDLEDNTLTVDLIPSKRPEEAKRGAMIRCVTSQNVHWYRDICKKHGSWRAKPRQRRKPDTRIKRENMRALLRRASRGKGVDSRYYGILLDICERDYYVPF